MYNLCIHSLSLHMYERFHSNKVNSIVMEQANEYI